MDSGARMRSGGLLKTVDLGRVEKAFKDAGFLVESVIRTARCITVSFNAETIDDAESEDGKLRLKASLLLKEDSAVFRWNKLPTKFYYHVRKAFPDAPATYEAQAIQVWNNLVGEEG